MNTIKLNFDSLKKDHWNEQEIANGEFVLEFVQSIMNDHDFDLVMEKYSDGPYKQHNRSMFDGLGGVVGTLKDFSDRYPDFAYDVKHMLVDGNYVTIHSHATLRKGDRGNDTKGLNIMDTWKVQDGKLVEHWDAVQPLEGFMRFYSLVNGGNVRNSNGVF
ncbi:MAG: nuclear transport factor 2 family protein [Chloroflexota bacterium]